MLKRLLLFALCASVVLAGAQAFAVSTIWDFSAQNLNAASGYDELVYRDTATQTNTFFYQTNGGTIPHIGGQVADYMNFPKSADIFAGYNIDRPYISSQLTSYTLLFDVLFTQATFDMENYSGLFNTNSANSNDADLYVDMRIEDGEGVPVQGRLFADRDSDNTKILTNAGIIQPNTWHRVAFAYDENHATEDVRIFVDGTKVGASDTEYGNSSFTVSDIIPVLTENNGETSDGYLSALAFVDHAMTDSELSTLGAPSVNGFASIADPGDPPVEPVGTNAYATALAATNPLVHLPLNRDSGAALGDPVENLGSFTGLAATWGLPGYDGTIPVSGAPGPSSAWQADGRDIEGFPIDNKCVQLTGHATAGSNSSSDMINLGNPAELDLDTVTWSLWFNTAETGSYRRMMITDPNYENTFYLVHHDETWYLATAPTGGGEEVTNNVAEFSIPGLNDSQWHHLVAVRQGDETDDCKLYIDGVEMDAVARRPGTFSPGYSFRIGCQGTSSGAWAGLMDEIAIWDRALSATEVADLFAAALAEGSELLPGDANDDGSVDVSDLGILATNYGATSGKTWGEGDFTGDGAVDVSDLGILATNYGTTAEASAVPEPSVLMMLAGIVLSIVLVRRR